MVRSGKQFLLPPGGKQKSQAAIHIEVLPRQCRADTFTVLSISCLHRAAPSVLFQFSCLFLLPFL